MVSGLELAPIAVERVHSIREYDEATRAIRAGEIGLVAFSIHNPEISPILIPPGWRGFLKNKKPELPKGFYVNAETHKRIDRATKGQFSATIELARANEATFNGGKLKHRAIPITPKDDIGPHIDPTMVFDSITDLKSAPLTHWYSAIGGCTARIAQVVGPDKDILALTNKDFQDQVAQDLIDRFNAISTSIDLDQGDVAAFPANGQVFSPKDEHSLASVALNPVMHDFATEGLSRVTLSI